MFRRMLGESIRLRAGMTRIDLGDRSNGDRHLKFCKKYVP